MLLSVYQYDIEFRSTTEHANANGFSRLLIQTINKGEESAIVASMFNLNQISVLPLRAKLLKQATDSRGVARILGKGMLDYARAKFLCHTHFLTGKVKVQIVTENAF